MLCWYYALDTCPTWLGLIAGDIRKCRGACRGWLSGQCRLCQDPIPRVILVVLALFKPSFGIGIGTGKGDRLPVSEGG